MLFDNYPLIMNGKGLTISFFLFVLTSTFPFGKSFNFSIFVLVSNLSNRLKFRHVKQIRLEIVFIVKNEKQLKIRKEKRKKKKLYSNNSEFYFQPMVVQAFSHYAWVDARYAGLQLPDAIPRLDLFLAQFHGLSWLQHLHYWYALHYSRHAMPNVPH